MHLHIGNGLEPNSTFPFETIRNVAMILLVYEPLLDGLPNGILYPAALPVHPVRALLQIYHRRLILIVARPEFDLIFIIDS